MVMKDETIVYLAKVALANDVIADVQVLPFEHPQRVVRHRLLILNWL